MARRTTKADLILKGARERVAEAREYADEAEAKVKDAQSGMEVAYAILQAHQFALEQLEKDLAQTPRKVKDPKSPAPAARGRSSRKPGKVESTANTVTAKGDVGSAPKLPMCVICGHSEAFVDHQTESENYHIFRTELKKTASAGVKT